MLLVTFAFDQVFLAPTLFSLMLQLCVLLLSQPSWASHLFLLYQFCSFLSFFGAHFLSRAPSLRNLVGCICLNFTLLAAVFAVFNLVSVFVIDRHADACCLLLVCRSYEPLSLRSPEADEGFELCAPRRLSTLQIRLLSSLFLGLCRLVSVVRECLSGLGDYITVHLVLWSDVRHVQKGVHVCLEHHLSRHLIERQLYLYSFLGFFFWFGTRLVTSSFVSDLSPFNLVLNFKSIEYVQ